MTATPQAQQANARVDRLEGVRTSRPQSAPLARAERVESLRARIEARTDAQAAREFRATVAEARQHVRGWAAEKAVSAKTADRYGRAVDAMQVKGEKPEDARCRASYDFRRAALVHETRKDIKSALTEVDRAQRQGDIKRAAAAFNRVRDGLETLRKYPPSTGNREADLQRSSVYSGPRQADQDRSNGKRGSLASLPEDWRDQVQRAVNDKDKAAVAAMSLSGCRPAEVRGIKVKQDDESIALTIKSAKYDADRGIKVRELTLDKSELDQTEAGRDLRDWLGGREVRTVTHDGTVEAFRERVGRAADRAGLEQASAYSFRHDTARELREAGVDKSEIAERLGHRSERAQRFYG